MTVQLSKRSSGWIHGAPSVILKPPRRSRAVGLVSTEAVRRAFELMVRMVRAGTRLWLRSVARRGADHKQEALFGGGQLGNVVLGMCATDMLLHGAVPLLLEFVLRQRRAFFVSSTRCCGGPLEKKAVRVATAATHPDAALAAARAILVAQRTDNLIVRIGDGKGRR